MTSGATAITMTVMSPTTPITDVHRRAFVAQRMWIGQPCCRNRLGGSLPSFVTARCRTRMMPPDSGANPPVAEKRA